MQELGVSIDRKRESIVEEAMEVKNDLLEKTDNPRTHWRAVISNDSPRSRADIAFADTSSSIFPVPDESIDNEDIEFFLSYSRENSIPLNAYPTNYFEAGEDLAEAQEALSDYRTEVYVSRKAEAVTIEDVLEELEESELDVELTVYSDERPQGFLKFGYTEDRLSEWYGDTMNEDFRSDVEDKLAEQGLLYQE
jgi:hypothetical protein